jgi:hypothetical protein
MIQWSSHRIRRASKSPPFKMTVSDRSKRELRDEFPQKTGPLRSHCRIHADNSWTQNRQFANLACDPIPVA